MINPSPNAFSDDIDGDGESRPVVVQTTTDAVHDVMNLSTQIFTSASKAVRVLSDCLDYDKIETGRLKLKNQFLNIWDLLSQIIDEFQTSFKSKNVGLDLDWTGINLILDEETGWPNDESTLNQCVIGDSAKLTMVFRNLLSTSLKFTPEGGKVTVRPEWNECDSRNGMMDEIQLSDDCVHQPGNNKKTKRQRSSTSLQDDDDLANDSDGSEYNQTGTFLRSGMLKFSIEDTSVGVSPDPIHSRLFIDGVLQGKRKNKNQGSSSGMGLFIAKGIMRGHGGDMMERSDGLHCGSSFVVTVPMYHVPSWRTETSDSVEVTTLTASRHSNISGRLSLPRNSGNDTGIARPTSFDLATPQCMVDGTSNLPSSSPSSSSSSVVSSVSVALSAFTEHGPSGKQQRRQLRILVVDDVSANRKLLSRLLEKKGHICDQAEDGQVAITKVKTSWEEYHLNAKNGTSKSKNSSSTDTSSPGNDEQQQQQQYNGTTATTDNGSNGFLYDVILMDYEMPVVNGPTSVRTMKQELPEYFLLQSPPPPTRPPPTRLPPPSQNLKKKNKKKMTVVKNNNNDDDDKKENGKKKRCVVIGVTGNVLPEDVDWFQQCGADHVLPKPLELSSLERLLYEEGILSL